MARRRVKKRTHVGANNGANVPQNGKAIDKLPKSMVIRIGAGEVGPSISQLVKDVRSVMEPGTAARLKERKSNKLRDFTTMAGPLAVTHLMLFSRSETGNTNMRLAITPRGPTLNFRVENYSLCKDVLKSQRHPKSSKQLYLNAPLLVMNNFNTPPSASKSPEDPAAVPKHLETLVTTIFQSLFPPLSPQTTPLSSIKRILLLNREPPTDPANNAYTITLRHYAINTKSTGLPKSLKRLNNAEKRDKKDKGRGVGVPNLGKLEDVADYLLQADAGEGNYTSASESEPETDAEVEVLASGTKKILSRSQREKVREAQDAGKGKSFSEKGRPGLEKRAIQLKELGPRMRLRLVKVEEGLCGGKIMWHDFVQKTKAQEKELEAKWNVKRKEKEERKRIQRENVERKKKERGSGKGEEGEDEDDEDFWDSEDEMNDVGGGAEVDGEKEEEYETEEEDEDEDEDEEMEEGGG
ncbi:Brix-domain-containing protein [Tothia fuscella]|uniref:Brix-domain-containing protein n=1 Tax=Tothia fuscella TaxID=1048955 RepID=A0A9P4NU85_9PEZI|nr:Brix-domain-containing protein [Tothia fuscella]